MKILTACDQFITTKKQVFLTIGSFDGIHKGHQELLKKLVDKNSESVVLTFSNHPSEVLSSQPSLRLMTIPHKLRLLEKAGVDTTILLPFTKNFSEQSPAAFLSFLKKVIPFTHLFLGHDAVIGHQRQGNRTVLSQLAKELFFHLDFIDPVTSDHLPISSSRIRNAILHGNFPLIELLLGRPYSLTSIPRLHDETTLFFSLEGLCLPPSGHYHMKVSSQKTSCEGMGKLNSEIASLEVSFFTYHEFSPSDEIEMCFLKKSI